MGDEIDRPRGDGRNVRASDLRQLQMQNECGSPLGTRWRSPFVTVRKYWAMLHELEMEITTGSRQEK